MPDIEIMKFCQNHWSLMCNRSRPPNAHIFAKMALNILEKLSAASVGGNKPNTERKRKRSESSNSSTSTRQQQLGGSVSLPQQDRCCSTAFRGQARGLNQGWDVTSTAVAVASSIPRQGLKRPCRTRPGGHPRGRFWPRW
jgi:hypothetical protein